METSKKENVRSRAYSLKRIIGRKINPQIVKEYDYRYVKSYGDLWTHSVEIFLHNSTSNENGFGVCFLTKADGTVVVADRIRYYSGMGFSIKRFSDELETSLVRVVRSILFDCKISYEADFSVLKEINESVCENSEMSADEILDSWLEESKEWFIPEIFIAINEKKDSLEQYTSRLIRRLSRYMEKGESEIVINIMYYLYVAFFSTHGEEPVKTFLQTFKLWIDEVYIPPYNWPLNEKKAKLQEWLR